MNIHTPSDHVLIKNAGLGAITAATVAGSTIDCQGYTRAMVVFTSAPSGTSTTSDAKIQSGAASDGSDAADVTGGAFTQKTTVGGKTTQAINVRILTNRYLTVPHTGAGGSAAGQFCITVHLFNSGYSPVAQDLTPKTVTI
jgi:hypothetical protein